MMRHGFRTLKGCTVTMGANILNAKWLNQSDAKAKMGKVYNVDTFMIFISLFLISS